MVLMLQEVAIGLCYMNMHQIFIIINHSQVCVIISAHCPCNIIIIICYILINGCLTTTLSLSHCMSSPLLQYLNSMKAWMILVKFLIVNSDSKGCLQCSVQVAMICLLVNPYTKYCARGMIGIREGGLEWKVEKIISTVFNSISN